MNIRNPPSSVSIRDNDMAGYIYLSYGLRIAFNNLIIMYNVKYITDFYLYKCLKSVARSENWDDPQQYDKYVIWSAFHFRRTTSSDN